MKMLTLLAYTIVIEMGNKNCLTLALDFYLGLQGRVGVEYQNEALTLTQIITENGNRRASGPVHLIPLIPLHLYTLYKNNTGLVSNIS